MEETAAQPGMMANIIGSSFFVFVVVGGLIMLALWLRFVFHDTQAEYKYKPD